MGWISQLGVELRTALNGLCNQDQRRVNGVVNDLKQTKAWQGVTQDLSKYEDLQASGITQLSRLSPGEVKRVREDSDARAAMNALKYSIHSDL